jgi:hypothetical protein
MIQITLRDFFVGHDPESKNYITVALGRGAVSRIVDSVT